ncbi:MAG: hypothetical protein PHW60_11965 [Kiritimatiellae bacterium]|nr:hypothetical protein [Kiritimatiellia bacterium]
MSKSTGGHGAKPSRNPRKPGETRMKLGLQSDYGSPRHWRRLVEFAKAQRVDRLVFIGSDNGCFIPYLFPRYPGLLTEEEQRRHRVVREYMTQAAQMTEQAGIEFWHWFHILQIPNSADRWRALEPGMFNAAGEPDMADPRIYRLLTDQIDELLEIAPRLAGLAMWICENATVTLSALRSQSISAQEIAERILSAVRAKCARHGLQFSVCLHTGSCDLSEAFLAAARKYPDIIVAGDSTPGDHNLDIGFNPDLWRAAATNPVQVGFDLNGEFWGRNIYPTSALGHYAQFLNEARALGAVWVEGRVDTLHNDWSPYANVLPSRRHFFPELTGWRAEDPIPKDMEVNCFDTLGGFNAEFFCRYAKDPSVNPRAVVGEFLKAEFGTDLPELADVLLEVEAVNARIFYAGQGYFGIQSCLPGRMGTMRWSQVLLDDIRFVTPAGELLRFPIAGRSELLSKPYFTGIGFPSARCPGPHALIAEKQEALNDARDLLARAARSTELLATEPRRFIMRHFEDWVCYAQGAALLLEAMVHYFHLCAEKQSRDIPGIERLGQVLREMLDTAAAWERRQPHDEWWNARGLRYWHGLISRALACAPLLHAYRANAARSPARAGQAVYVFGPADRRFAAPPDQLTILPERLVTTEGTLLPQEATMTRGQLDMASGFVGKELGRSAYVYVPFDLDGDQDLVFWFGADMHFVAFVDGRQIGDTIKMGTVASMPLRKGPHLLVVRYINWSTARRLAVSAFDRSLRTVIG